MYTFSQYFITITELVSSHLCSLFTSLYYLLLITNWKCKIFCENYYEFKVLDLFRFNSIGSSPSRLIYTGWYLVKIYDMTFFGCWITNDDMTFTNWLIVIFGRFLFIFFSTKSNSLKEKMTLQKELTTLFSNHRREIIKFSGGWIMWFIILLKSFYLFKIIELEIFLIKN